MFKGIMNVIAGEIFKNSHPDWFVQQIQLVIIMIGSNPFGGGIFSIFG